MSNPSSSSDLADKLKPVVKTLRIIVLALAMGLITFMGITVVNRQKGAAQPAGDAADFLVPLAMVLAATAATMSWVLPPVVVKKARGRIAAGKLELPSFSPMYGSQTPGPELGNAGKLAMVYQTQMIMAAAMLEGAAFVNVLAYQFTGNNVTLGVAVALAVAIVARCPSAAGLAEWIEEQLRLMEEEKLLGQ